MSIKDIIKQYLPYYVFGGTIVVISVVAIKNRKKIKEYIKRKFKKNLCGSKGVPYQNQPCDKAVNYYRSSNGKKNYFQLGVDSKGMAYFGRGLIQLTGLSNYRKYGRLAGLGDTLVQNGDLALVPKNSYKIASAYMNARTFKYVNEDNLTQARKSVNGGTKGVDRTNQTYYKWLNVFKNPNAKFEVLFWTKRKRILFAILGVGLLATGGFFIYKGIGK